MKYLLDTNVISELVAKVPNPKVVDWVDALDPLDVYLSVVTIGEIRKGIEKMPDSDRKTKLHAWLADDLLFRFEDRILSLGIAEMLEWGIMVGRAERSGRSLSAIDSLIAALSLYNDCALVTRNVDDFAGLGVRVVNPWNE